MGIMYPLAMAVLMLGGLCFWVLAWRRRTPEFPGITFDPRKWKPVWKMKDWFTPDGYRYNLIGTFCVSLAGVVTLLKLILRST